MSSRFLPFLCLSSFFLSVAGQCHSGWVLVHRNSGEWCIQIFFGDTTGYGAVDRCAGQGAVLTGIENTEEMHVIINQMKQITMKNALPPDAGFWIGAQRRCNCFDNRNPNECTRENIYAWADGLTKGYWGFTRWAYKEPKGYYQRTNVEDCVYVRYNNRKMDGELADAKCEERNPAVRGYVCGRAPLALDQI
ncbi:unnamed protein product [Caenorhabditis auriculariae]|uniref:C-type lectin domain-containing protein n=1 Tax=Caenorhabditis auriculariae TaxID=2777116 RepID=A0A8S1HED2_9PELO|nr:unnamed protein product [Caenorhabditis auriculariae]